MIIRKIDELHDTAREVKSKNWKSTRLLLKHDNMGFSFHETIVLAGTETKIHYKNHLESVYCVEGTGEITDLDTGKKYSIEPGTLYALDKHDRHILTAFSTMRMLCVFNPPCVGNEVHDDQGAYPLLET